MVNDWLTVLNLATMTSVGLNEDVDEVAKDLLIGRTLNDDEAPRLQWFRVGEQELLATKVPTALSTRVELLASELDFGVGKQASSSLEEVSKGFLK